MVGVKIGIDLGMVPKKTYALKCQENAVKLSIYYLFLKRTRATRYFLQNQKKLLLAFSNLENTYIVYLSDDVPPAPLRVNNLTREMHRMSNCIFTLRVQTFIAFILLYGYFGFQF